MAGRPAHTRDYGTASYLCDPETPIEVSDAPLWVTVAFCRRCGAIVHDIAKHDDFHRGV